MRLKPAIQIIEYSNLALIIGLFIGVISVVSKSGDGKILIFEILFAVPFLLAYFFRMVLINWYLKTCKYPAIFLAVLDKLGLTKDFDINWSEDAERDMHKPTYSTEEFLVDNNLILDIGAKKVQIPFIIISIGLGILGLYYFSQKVTFKEKPLLYIFILLFIAMNIYFWFKGKRQQNDTEPIARFTNKGLFINEQLFDWTVIFDWNYEAGGKSSSDKIVINYYDVEKNIFETALDLGQVNSDKIDFMMLLTHFQSKYG